MVCLWEILFGFSFYRMIHSAETGSQPESELLLVQLVFRHGDRNPLRSYPTDPYKNESLWPEGFEQLTKVGKMQQFQLGQFVRKRYDGFLSKVYSPYEIYIQSSSVDRAIMSALANLAGLYPPNDNQSMWHPNITWQPIPVHTIPDKMDNTIHLHAPCSRYDQIFQDFEANSDVMQRIYGDENTKEIFETLSKFSGSKISSIRDFRSIFGTLNVEKHKNLTLPSWAVDLETKFGNKLLDLFTFACKMFTYTTEMKRLKGGPMVKGLTDNMLAKRNQSMEPRRKFFISSGHDTTISALLNTLDIFNDIDPPYCAMVMIEFRQNVTSNKYYVEILYRNSTDHEPFKMVIPGCSFSCDFETYLNLVSGLIPSNWTTECQPVTPPPPDTVATIVTIFLVFVLIGVCVVVGLIMKAYFRNTRRAEPTVPKYPYLHLQMEDRDRQGVAEIEEH